LTVLAATLIYAMQSVVSKMVEQTIPSMQVVMIRSFIGGLITAVTIGVKHHKSSSKNGMRTSHT
jgi:uncharacterized membrane protein